MKDYERVSLNPTLANALHAHIKIINPELSLREVVVQACMEYLEKRSGINVAPTNAIQDTGTVEKKTKKIPQKEDVLGFSDFLDD